MTNFVVLNCLLSAATIMLLMNQQAMLVEAKPFLLLPTNFFVLTTRAPCTTERTTNCKSNQTPSGSGSSSGGVQTFNLFEPKLRFLTTILQSFIGAGSSKGGISGGFGFGFNKFIGQRPATTTTTTTTSSPDKVTEPDTVFTPDTVESTTATSAGTTTTTPQPGGIDEEDKKPGYIYENKMNGLSGSLSVTADTSDGIVSTNIALSNILGENNETDEKDGKTSSLNDNGTGYNYEETENNATSPGTDYQYNNDNHESSTEKTPGYEYDQETSSSSSQRTGYQYDNGNDGGNGSSFTHSSGYEYGIPAENEVLR